MKRILFQDTSYRDGFQSVLGARVLTDDFIDTIEAAVHAGIDHFEAGGGARFQSLFLYCGESAFTMMDRIREKVGPKVNLQTLARGINVVALSAQPKDMIELHAKMFKKHGISHIRNFDALNDIRNLQYSGEVIKAAGLHHQAVVTIMDLPPGSEGAHDADFYLAKVREILDSGIPYDSICFKDAAGTANPKKIYETVKRTRELVGDDVVLWHHTHDTAAIGITQYQASIEAGITGICLARKPVSGGTSQPDMIAMEHALKGSGYTLNLDVPKILEANAIFKKSMSEYYFPPEAISNSPEVLLSPMPGGALTANTMMMRDTGTLHLYPKTIEAMAECVARGGFGTSVTPVSQFYFQQAFANVTQGPWKKITDGYGNMILGYFGRTPVPPDPELVKIAAEQMGKEPFDGDPLEIIPPGRTEAEKLLKEAGLEVNDENVFITSALATPGGNRGLDFLKGNATVNVRKEAADGAPAAKPAAPAAAGASGPSQYKVTVDGRSYDVVVEEGTGSVQSINPAAAATPAPAAPSAGAPAPAASGEEIAANMPGNVLRVTAKVGDTVSEGQTVLVLEAMKMETQVASPKAGKLTAVHVGEGDVVTAGQALFNVA